MKNRICIIGLDQTLKNEIRKHHFGGLIHHDLVPKFLVDRGRLLVESSNGVGMKEVDKVIFHGIFADDFDLLTGLTIWGGACFPNALSMLNCRLKLPCLARALQVSQFNSPRGLISSNTEINIKTKRVAKWGNWHCGENKAIVEGKWTSDEPAIIEPYFAGESVRIVILGDVHYQIKLEGESWLKSIHSPIADFMEVDAELLADTQHVKAALGMDMIANDYIIGEDGEKHLLEVNHIPNVTRFPELQAAYLDAVTEWLQQ